LINKYIQPNQKYIWIPLAFIFKMLLSLYLLHSILLNSDQITQTYAMVAGDTFSYFGAFDNLISKGEYDPFYRMPGVGFIYYLFRLLFSQQISHAFFVLFQIVFDSIACYFLSKLAYQLTKSKLFFVITFILSVSNSYFSVFNIWLLSESLCTSSLILSVYFFYQAILHKHQKEKSILLCGLFISWAIFCRPIYVPVLLFYFILFTFYLYKKNIKLLSRYLLIFISPFLLFDAIWVYAGYQHSHKLFFLQHSSYQTSKENNKNTEAYMREPWKIALVQFVTSFGGDVVDWNPDAEITWFNANIQFKQSKECKLPGYAFTDYYNQDSLVLVKRNIEIIYDSLTKNPVRDSLKATTEQSLTRFTQNFKKQKPFHYHVLSRLIILKKFLFHQPTYNLYSKPFNELNKINKTIKLLFFLMYYIYLFGFFMSLIYLLINKKILLFLPVLLLVFFGIGIYPFLRFCEYRYIVPVIPFLLFLSSYTIYSILKLFRKTTWKRYPV
jgi:hypothetical protein